MIPSSSFSLAAIVRLLYIQNPFYLIGTFLILFGLQQCFGQGDDLSASGMLVGLLAAYAILLAAAATIIIRCGQVWDDARTILLVIVLLFFMLSASLDVHLLYMPLAGSLFLVAGLVFSVSLSEGLLRVLRIRLAAAYRGPYYAMLALLFLYPLAPAWINYFGWHELRPWVLFAFPSLSALALLALLPAARTSAGREAPSGTPWKWPYYPWSLFVYLTIGVAIRSWWLAYSFEPTIGTDGYFQPYFLMPLVLAWSALVLEMGKARGSAAAVAGGLLLPVACLVLGFLPPGTSGEQLAFLARLSALGTPAQLAVWSLILFYVWAWLRRVPAAEGFLVTVALLASVVGSQTLDWGSLSRPNPLPAALVVLGLFALAIWRQSSWRALAATALAAMGLRYVGGETAAGDELAFWQWHAPILAVLAVAACFRDELAAELRELAWRGAPVLALVGAAVYPWTMPAVSSTSVATYLALLLAAVALWGRQKEVGPLVGALLALAANLLAHGRHGYAALANSPLADGLPWLTIGAAAVSLAFFISLLKMGLWPAAGQCVVRINRALGGVPPKPA